MTTITINPCPFCGHDDVEIDEVGIAEFAVDCPECRAIGPITGDIMGAIRLWNVRAPAVFGLAEFNVSNLQVAA